MSEPLTELFSRCREEGRAALLPYMTAGLPTPEESLTLFAAMAEAGADGFEVGIPYADPLMDGPVIQAAGERALSAGSGVEVSLDVLREVVGSTGKPTVVMTYVNPVLRMGIEAFADRVAAAGGSGIIIADLPVDEAEVFAAAFRKRDIGLVLFVAPTTTDVRLERVLAAKPPFVYGIADLGVTGARTAASTHIAALVERVRRHSDVPVVAGVGISTPEQAHAAACVADGVIVGTALVREVMGATDAASAAEALRLAVGGFAAAMQRD
ncbi:MAG: tryptophan synthase subunit alpha [Acidimicrobiia bacterium]|nr:tryptophan synthase subunit alpha [Acidimicrobiia bacterium]